MASRRQQRLGLVLAGAIVVAVVLLLYWQAGVLFPFAVSGVLAYVLYPAVRALERVMPWRTRRPGLSRIVSITLIYSVALTLIAGVLALIAPRIVEESTDFISEFPQLFPLRPSNSGAVEPAICRARTRGDKTECRKKPWLAPATL